MCDRSNLAQFLKYLRPRLFNDFLNSKLKILNYLSFFVNFDRRKMDAIRVPIEDDKGYLVRIRFQEFLQSYGKQNDDQENAKEITQQM